MSFLVIAASLVFVVCVLQFVLTMTVALLRKSSGNSALKSSQGEQTRDLKCNPCLRAGLSSWISRKCKTGQSNEELQILDGGCWPSNTSNPIINCSSLSGFAADGSCNAFLRVAERPGCQAEAWILIEHREIGLLQLLINSHSEDEVKGLSAANLKLECIEPLRVWKAAYNGLLRLKRWNDEAERDVHVKICLRWSAFTGVFKFDSPVCSRCSNGIHWEQWGQLQGYMTVEEMGRYPISLRGTKARSFGLGTWANIHTALHYGRLETGTVFHLAAMCKKERCSRTIDGYVIKPNGICESITSCNLDLNSFTNTKDLPSDYVIMFETECDHYRLECHINSEHPFSGEGAGKEVFVLERLASFTLNGIPGKGTSEVTSRCSSGDIDRSCRSQPLAAAVKFESAKSLPHPLTVSLSDPMCCQVNLAGGKGSQLARLQALSTIQFTVPAGFCVTTHALDQHIQENSKLVLLLSELQTACQQTTYSENMASLYQRIEACFVQSKLSNQLSDSISKDYAELSEHDVTVAVRSSAVSEDSEDSSSAGQMETYLNVKGSASVLGHVLRCWASLYTYQAVHYRQEHGQGVLSRMAVVVQLMVPSETSGVLFTVDPITGNPKTMLINGSYGLGENVVSGHVTPDTVEVERKSDQSLHVKSVSLGDIKASCPPKQNELELNCGCLSRDQVMMLATIGLKIEGLFGSAVDVEWAVEGGRFYVLQARPVTTLFTETDDEVLHELDTALATDNEWLTTCNIGEMMPGALTPLSQSVFAQAVEDACQNIQVSWGLMSSTVTPTMKSLGVYSGCCFINLHTMSNTYENNVLISNKKFAELGLCGKVLDGLTWEMIREHNGQASLWRRMTNGMKAIQYLCSGRHKLDELESIVSTFYLERKSTAAEMYAAITEYLPLYYNAWDTHMLFSAKSGMWSSILVSIICRKMDDLTSDVSSGLSLLLSACSGVESADVPSSLEDLADIMVHENGTKACKAFVQCDHQEALLWFQNADSSSANKCFQQFLDKHGHRCLREAEFAVKPWADDPSALIPAIQALVQQRINAQTAEMLPCSPSVQNRNKEYIDVSVSSSKKCRSWTTETKDVGGNEFDKILDKLKLNLSWMKRKFIQWVLPKCRKAVRQREKGKSLAVKMTDHFRKAYQHLGKLLVSEEYLPEDNLVYFLTQYEISQLLGGKTSIVTKAIRRRKLYPSQMGRRYPVFNIGTPQPVKGQTREENSGSLQMQGMPVSQGVAEGKARVILDVKDSVHIQPGDVLVTQCTDVGWSPYFTVIGGLVTELGGLLSHGAVVAREYGLPCVASVAGATVTIRTGDVIRLDGSCGTVTRITESDV